MDTMKIRAAGRKDIDDLRIIWAEAFGEAESFDKYMTYIRVEEIVKVVEINNEEIVSMLSLIPCTYRETDRIYEGYYLYAAATKGQKKKQNYMTMLLKTLQQECRDAGKDFIFTIPAEDSLFAYYEKRGFTGEVFGIKEINGIDCAGWMEQKFCIEKSPLLRPEADPVINLQFPPEIADYVCDELSSSKKCNILYRKKENGQTDYLIRRNAELMVYGSAYGTQIMLPANVEVEYKLTGKVYWANGLNFPMKMNGFIPF